MYTALMIIYLIGLLASILTLTVGYIIADREQDLEVTIGTIVMGILVFVFFPIVLMGMIGVLITVGLVQLDDWFEATYPFTKVLYKKKANKETNDG